MYREGRFHSLKATADARPVTLSTLLATSDPLFHRALLMSGDITVRRPQSMAWQEAMLRENLTYLGLDDSDLKEVINKLRLLPASDIVQVVPMVQHWSATLDEDFLPGLRAADLTITNTWCKSILTGDMAHDVRIYGYISSLQDKTDEPRHDRAPFYARGTWIEWMQRR